MVKRKLSTYILLVFILLPSFLNANPNIDQWLESDKTYKDLINEGFEVKSYTFNNVETANDLYILLFINEIYECQEYQTIDKKIETLDMQLICKQLVQPYERGLGT